MIRAAALACVAAMLLGCASQPAPEESPLRKQAVAAAEAGSARFAGRHFDASARSFGQAAQIYGALDDPTAEAAALRNQAEALRRAGSLAEATAGFERALTIDRLAERPDAQARDLAGLARCASAQGDVGRAIQEAERALGLVAGPDALRALLEIDLAVYLLARGEVTDQSRVVELLTSAGDFATAQAKPRIAAAAHLHLGRAQSRFGSPDLAEGSLRLALSEFREQDDPEGLARTHEELGRLLTVRNQPEAARRHFAQARRGYEFVGDEATLLRLDELLGETRD